MFNIRPCHSLKKGPSQAGLRLRLNMSRLVGKPTMLFLNRSDTNRAAQAKKSVIGLKFWI